MRLIRDSRLLEKLAYTIIYICVNFGLLHLLLCSFLSMSLAFHSPTYSRIRRLVSPSLSYHKAYSFRLASSTVIAPPPSFMDDEQQETSPSFTTRKIQQSLFPNPFIHQVPLPTEDEINGLVSFLRKSRYLIAITGAGISTNSGIPDYRGPEGSYKRGHKPMSHQEFIHQEVSRQRYWLRSMMGWQKFSLAQPNDGHFALAQLESSKHSHLLKYIITQNVDRLHSSAGSRHVIDLHGRIDRIRCLTCGSTTSRRIMQQSLQGLNPYYHKLLQEMLYKQRQEHMRADGDMDLDNAIVDYSSFVVPCCHKCSSSSSSSATSAASSSSAKGEGGVHQGGILKPDVVFFGDNVPMERVEKIHAQVDQCDAVLVVGTSLEVYSAYRFIDKINKQGKPIAIINYGETRAERQRLPMITYKSNANCAVLLKAAVDRL